MNDMDIIRDFMRAPSGPSMATITASENRLTAEFSAGRTKRRGRRFVLRIALPVIAAGAAAAVAIVPLGPDGSAPKKPAVTPELSVGQVMLAAATTQESTATPSGRYWVVKMRHGSFVTVGTEAAPYRIRHVSRTDDWTSRDGREEWYIDQSLGTKPAGPADEAAWRRAGSPTAWNPLGISRPPAGKGRYMYHAAPDRTGSRPMRVDESKRTAWDRGQVPDDLAKIRQMILADDKRPRPLSKLDQDKIIFTGGGSLLAGHLTPALRAKVYRIIATLPEVKLRRNVRDPEGRTGTAISWISAGALEDRLIIDPASGRTLAFVQIDLKGNSRLGVRPGGILGYQSIVSAGWANEAPKP